MWQKLLYETFYTLSSIPSVYWVSASQEHDGECNGKMFWRYCRYSVCWCRRCLWLQVNFTLKFIQGKLNKAFQWKAEKIVQKFAWDCEKGCNSLEREWSGVCGSAGGYHWFKSKGAQGIRIGMWKGKCRQIWQQCHTHKGWQVLRELNKSGCKHLVNIIGNHELYNFSRKELDKRLGIRMNGSTWYSYKPWEDVPLRF